MNFRPQILYFCAPLMFAASCRAQPNAATAPPSPMRQTEKLSRAVIALVQNGGKVWVSWRLLPGEEQVGFNLYRQDGGKIVRLNARPLTGATNFVDENADLTRENRYFVRAIQNGAESSPSKAWVLKANTPARPYFSIPLQTPAGYAPNDAAVADLDGDGEFDLVLHQAGRGKDNSQNGETDPPILQGLKMDGTLLWTINLGRNIREGAHYTQFMVFDLDGDGRAEIVCKTADGTVDGTGKVIGDAKANYVNESGRILSGPEYLTVFDGKTGAALATTNYLPSRMPDDPKNLNPTSDQLKAVWGDGYGNRNDRFLACIAYLDGVHPSVVMCRGYYTRTVLAAWDWRGGKLTSRWVFDTNTPGNEKFAAQGNHNLSVADVDGDGRDEIIYGKMAVDDDGTGMYSTGIGHGDAIHVGDLNPDRPGLEVFSIQEPWGDAGAHMFDARTGEILWKKASVTKQTNKKVEGPGRGLALDVDPRTRGSESWVAGSGLSNLMWDCRGNLIPTDGKTPSVNMGIYWDGDLLSELLDGTTVTKWNWNTNHADTLLDAKPFGAVSNNSTKANPVLSADLFGDWREEVIFRSADNRELQVYSSMFPTKHRLPTLMSDHLYRMDVAWQNVGYNQPPHLSYFLDPSADYPAETPKIAANSNAMKFAFDANTNAATAGYQKVAAARYDDKIGYGFENNSANPASFSVKVPEGFYDVTMTFGAEKNATATSVKAEARRLMLQNVTTQPGEIVTRHFSVAVKRPELKGGGAVHLKSSQSPLDWDDKLTLEWGGSAPAVRSLEIAPARQKVGIFIAGDSTVTDQGGEPYVGWGQSLPRFFRPNAVVYNNAQSGETLASFAAAGLQQKIWEQAKPGDYLLIQFGHNDQKDKSPDALEKYKANLEKYIAAARKNKVNPILVTPMERRIFKGDNLVPTLALNAAAMREVGATENVPIVDLNAASVKLFTALGPDKSKTAFVHYPAHTFPGQAKALRDDSHFNAYGAFELARLVADGLRAQTPELASLLTDDLAPLDPATPDDSKTLALFASAPHATNTPEGS